VLLAAAALALAQTQQQPAQGAQPQTGSPPMPDPAAPAAGTSVTGSRAAPLTAAAFARTAAMSDLYEMEASRLAEQRSQAAQVTPFAERMLRDHQKTTSELKGMLPQIQGVSASQLPTSLDQQHQALVQQLQGAPRSSTVSSPSSRSRRTRRRWICSAPTRSPATTRS
jgi:putative membrane protein